MCTKTTAESALKSGIHRNLQEFIENYKGNPKQAAYTNSLV